jgi:hypothetical protein
MKYISGKERTGSGKPHRREQKCGEDKLLSDAFDPTKTP